MNAASLSPTLTARILLLLLLLQFLLPLLLLLVLPLFVAVFFIIHALPTPALNSDLPPSRAPLSRVCCCSCSCIFQHRQIFLLSYHSHAFTIIACKFQAFKKSAQKTLTKSPKKLKKEPDKCLKKAKKKIDRQKSRQVPRVECV